MRLKLSMSLCLAVCISTNICLAATKKPVAKAKPAATPAAAKGPTQTKGTDFTSAYNSYLDNIRNKIFAIWQTAEGKNHVVLTMTVTPEGAVSDLSATSEPKNTLAEQNALDAFNKIEPLPALPAKSSTCKITLTFDSTADPHGDSQANLTTKMEPMKAESTPTPATSAPETPAAENNSSN